MCIALLILPQGMWLHFKMSTVYSNFLKLNLVFYLTLSTGLSMYERVKKSFGYISTQSKANAEAILLLIYVKINFHLSYADK